MILNYGLIGNKVTREIKPSTGFFDLAVHIGVTPQTIIDQKNRFSLKDGFIKILGYVVFQKTGASGQLSFQNFPYLVKNVLFNAAVPVIEVNGIGRAGYIPQALVNYNSNIMIFTLAPQSPALKTPLLDTDIIGGVGNSAIIHYFVDYEIEV